VVATVERRAPLDWHGNQGLAWRVRLRLPDGEAVDGMQVGDGAVTFLDPRVRAAEEAQGSVAPGAGTAGPVPTAIPTRPLGSAGPAITTVGFGAWAVGGAWAFGWGPQDDRDSIAAIHRALDAGVGWIDTAAAYGLGHSEEVVARALEGVAARPLVFTKCGLVSFPAICRALALALRGAVQSVVHYRLLPPVGPARHASRRSPAESSSDGSAWP
jgi:hypothetical protein